jgi:hypothetical protein
MKACRSVIIGVALCSAIFVFVVFPVVGTQIYRPRGWPIVDGHFTGHHSEYVRKSGWRVVASLDFDRPDSEGTVHCHFAEIYTGPADEEASYKPTAKFAVNTDTCNQFTQLPLNFPDNLTGWLVLLAYGCVGCIVWVFIVLIFVAPLFGKKPTNDALQRAGYKT